MPGLTERLTYRVAKRWIAGYTLEEAISDAQETNRKKMTAILNRLGEHTPVRTLIEEYTTEYLRLLRRMDDARISGAISVKPTQLGLAAESDLFSRNLDRILDAASRSKRTVWIDMENSPYTQATIDTYRNKLPAYPDIGLCLQSNLRRTRADMEGLLEAGGRIRLVKGAYPESSAIAFKRKAEIDKNYRELLGLLFEKGNSFVVGTHDDKLVKEAERLSGLHKVDFEFEFLKGIRDDLKERLVREGRRVGEYIPYGPEWYNYSKRRIRERKRNILLLLRSITG